MIPTVSVGAAEHSQPSGSSFNLKTERFTPSWVDTKVMVAVAPAVGGTYGTEGSAHETRNAHPTRETRVVEVERVTARFKKISTERC